MQLMAVDRKKGEKRKRKKKQKNTGTKRRGKFHVQKTKTQRQWVKEKFSRIRIPFNILKRRGNSLNPTTHRHTQNKNKNNNT